jgi:hypothetical protein
LKLRRPKCTARWRLALPAPPMRII